MSKGKKSAGKAAPPSDVNWEQALTEEVLEKASPPLAFHLWLDSLVFESFNIPPLHPIHSCLG